MDAIAAVEPYVHARRAVIQAPATRGNKAGSQGAYLPFVCETDAAPLQTAASIEPHGIRPIDEDVSNCGITGELLQGAKAVQFCADRFHGSEGTCGTEHASGCVHRRCDT